jgi:hypothetical protein
MNFIWNTKKIKTIIFKPEGREQVEMTPRQIVDNPNRHQIEPILAALCSVASELIKIQEEQAERIKQMMSPKIGSAQQEFFPENQGG